MVAFKSQSSLGSKVGIGDVEEGVGMEHAYGMGASFVE